MKTENKTKKAAFGAGCFWHTEEDFRVLPGVTSTSVGFMGGKTKNPSYMAVCTGLTGHIETALIEYDPEKITYEKLLNIFFENHNPTTMNRQGLDIGTQYKSAIFYYDDVQKKIAEKKIEELSKIEKYKGKKIVTVLLPATNFYPAEEYHQKYLMKKGLKSCGI